MARLILSLHLYQVERLFTRAQRLTLAPLTLVVFRQDHVEAFASHDLAQALLLVNDIIQRLLDESFLYVYHLLVVLQ